MGFKRLLKMKEVKIYKEINYKKTIKYVEEKFRAINNQLIVY